MAMRSLQGILPPISTSPSNQRQSTTPNANGHCCAASAGRPSSLSFPSYRNHLFFSPIPNPNATTTTTTTTTAGFNRDELSLHPKPSSSSVVVLDHPYQEQAFIEKSAVRGQKHLKELSSWGIGGPCRYFLEISRPSHLISAIRFCRTRSIPFLVLGKGSNCLFSDRGFDGMVVLNRLHQSAVEVVEPGTYRVGSGYPFNRLGVRCSSEGFTGLEFAGGIPGTVGGAAFMNAGANGQEAGDVIESVEMVTREGELRVVRKGEMEFGYRWSSFQDLDDLAAIVAVTFRLTPAESARERQRAFLER